MQFLFGMMMIELIVRLTLGWARGMLWLVRWTLRTSWRVAKTVWPMARRTIGVMRESRAQMAQMQRQQDGKRHD
ncbi:hypothetical protein [Thiobacillus sp.]